MQERDQNRRMRRQMGTVERREEMGGAESWEARRTGAWIRKNERRGIRGVTRTRGQAGRRGRVERDT